MTDLTTIAVAALTGLFTILGVLLANRSSYSQLLKRLEHSDIQKEKEVLRSRLEELYQLIDEWSGILVIHHTTYRKVMRGYLTYNQALDLEIERDSNQNFKRMFTLAELYFPDAQPEFQEIKKLRDLASSIHSEFTELHRNTGNLSPKHADSVTHTLEQFNAAIDDYKSKLKKYVRNV